MEEYFLQFSKCRDEPVESEYVILNISCYIAVSLPFREISKIKLLSITELSSF